METYNDFNKQTATMPHRRWQELDKMTPKRQEDKLPYKAHIKRSVGEYYPTREDRLNVI